MIVRGPVWGIVKMATAKTSVFMINASKGRVGVRLLQIAVGFNAHLFANPHPHLATAAPYR
jgi:hypothetical protein